MIQVDIDRNESYGFQITLDGAILLTIRTDSPEGISGSVALSKGGEVELVEFHENGENWTIHESHPLES